MILRARVTIRVNGVVLPRFPFVRRIDDALLDVMPDTVVPPSSEAVAIFNTTSKVARAIKALDPVSIRCRSQADANVLKLGRDGLFMVFHEQYLGLTSVVNAQATPASVDVYAAE